MTKEQFKIYAELDKMTPDGTFTVSSGNIDYDIRTAAALSRKLGRPLTEKEVAALIKSADVLQAI
jgi:hypothetical protein